MTNTHLSLQASWPRRTPGYLGVFRVGLGVASRPELRLLSPEGHFSPKLGGRRIYTQGFIVLKLLCLFGADHAGLVEWIAWANLRNASPDWPETPMAANPNCLKSFDDEQAEHDMDEVCE
jgi:hypothetical protein